MLSVLELVYFAHEVPHLASGGQKSLFDLLEDLDAAACGSMGVFLACPTEGLKKCKEIAAANK